MCIHVLTLVFNSKIKNEMKYSPVKLNQILIYIKNGIQKGSKLQGTVSIILKLYNMFFVCLFFNLLCFMSHATLCMFSD